MAIQIKLQIEIDDVDDVQLLQALEKLLKHAKSSTEIDSDSSESIDESPRRRRPPKPRFADSPPRERWVQFLEALPPRAQNFIALVESSHPSVLSQSEAMSTLGIESAKAMGGLLGSLTRWAAVDHIRLPWVREELDGERTWRWIGIDAAIRGLDKPIPELSTLSLEDYGQVSPRLYRMLSLVHEAGKISGMEVSDAMKLESKAALTGLENALKRWIPNRGLPLPISFEGQGEERSYRWLAGQPS